MRLRILYESGAEQTVEAKPKDYIKFERKYVPMSRLAPASDGDAPGEYNIEWVYALAHFAYVREKAPAHDGGLKVEFDQWLDLVEDVTPIGEDGDDNPLEK